MTNPPLRHRHGPGFDPWLAEPGVLIPAAMVQDAMARGARVDAVDRQGWTILHRACLDDAHADLAAAVLAAGADPQRAISGGLHARWTPTLVAIENQAIGCLCHLLRHGSENPFLTDLRPQPDRLTDAITRCLDHPACVPQTREALRLHALRALPSEPALAAAVLSRGTA